MANRVYEWVDERTGIKPAVDYVMYRRIPKSVNWWFTFGSASLILFTIQVISGIFLAMGYTPSTAPVLRLDGSTSSEALESVRNITNSIPFGDWMRGFHHWGANLMVIVVLLHTVRVFFMGSYKYPRELTWFVGVVILLMVLGFSFTGYLLPWDNRAYWATQVGTKIGGSAPILGPSIESILKGGPNLGAATLSRFYSLHVLLLPSLTALLIGVHMFLVIKIGISGQPELKETVSDEYFDTSALKKKKAGRAFFPYIVFKDAVAGLVIVGLVVLATIFWPVENSNPVDPNNSYSTIEGKEGGTQYKDTKTGKLVEMAMDESGNPKSDANGNQVYVDSKGNTVSVNQTDLKQVIIPPQPEWYFLFLFQFLKLFPSEVNLGVFSITGEAIGGIVVPTILILLLLLAPVLDRGPKRSPLSRPIAIGSLAVVLVAMVLLTVLAINDLNASADSAASSSSSTAAAATTAPAASGATTTAASGGAAATTTVAASGGASTSTGDVAAGKKLFTATCQSCHPSGGKAVGSAGQPNLSTSTNITGADFLRNQIRNGGTSSAGTMTGFDKDTLTDAEVDNLVAYVLSIRK